MKMINYRPEIDGLRAIAVLSVILFHAGVQQLTGGFIGVDIFYVISGYLITKIIIGSLKKEEFTFSSFYVRRMKRLLPAALFMVFITVIFAALILTPGEYMALSKSAMSSNIFMANIWFMKHSGYFDLSTQISPLVHMWSLSVEEQFYFVFPFLLLVAYRIYGVKGVKLAIVILIITSFILSVVLSPLFPDFSFYMLFTRAWELGLGAILAIFPSLKPNRKLLANLISLMGVGLILYGLFSITHNDIYPGYLALLPVLGTVLILYSLDNNTSVVSGLLISRPLLFLGKISYSAYLWHWPIIVYYRIYISQRDFYSYEILLLIIGSLFTGYLSWRYIEEKYRYKKYSNKKVYKISSLSILFSISVFAVIYFSGGISTRMSEAEIAMTDSKLMNKWSCTEKIQIFPEISEKFCVVGLPWEESSEKGLIWGDSHSKHMSQLFHFQAIDNNMSFIIAPRSCPPYLNSENVKSYYPKFPDFTEKCTTKNNLTLNWLKNNDEVRLVVMSAAWSGHVRMLYTDKNISNKSNSLSNEKDVKLGVNLSTSVFDKFLSKLRILYTDKKLIDKFNVPLTERDTELGANLSKSALDKLLSQLGDKEILLLGDIPRPNKILNDCAIFETSSLLRSKCDDSRYKYLDSESVLSWHKSSDRVLRTLSTEFENVQTIIPSDSLCDDDYCQTYINDELIYSDGNHMRINFKPDTVKLLSNKIGLEDYFSTRKSY